MIERLKKQRMKRREAVRRREGKRELAYLVDMNPVRELRPEDECFFVECGEPISN
jgi:hypothetical protein